MAFAFGRMGLTPHEYYCLSPLEFHLKSKGYWESYWENWEHTRFIAYNVRATIPTKEKLPDIRKWLPLPSDKDRVDEGRVKRMLDKAKKWKTN